MSNRAGDAGKSQRPRPVVTIEPPLPDSTRDDPESANPTTETSPVELEPKK